MATYTAFGGGSIGNMLAQWEAAGIFAYVLPFLLIFAIVYSILSFINVFKGNKAVNAVVALATALMALQFQIVSVFFADIFPRLGIALSIILVIIILGGFFIDTTKSENSWIKWLLVIVTFVIIIVVIWGSLRDIGFGGGFSGFPFLYGINWAGILIGALIIGLIVWVIAAGNSNSSGAPKK